MIHVFIRFCMVLNPYMCQELEIAPQDHVVASQIECMRGIMMGDQSEFTYEGALWRIKGGRCEEVEKDQNIEAWMNELYH